MHLYFILHLHKIYTFDFCYFITKMTKMGNLLRNVFFILPNMNMPYIY